MKILSYHHSSTSPLHTPNSRAYIEWCHTHGDQAYLLETWTKPSKLNQHFGIQLITESRLRDSTSTYLFTSAGSCASFITALPQFHLCNRHVKHFQTLGWHYPDHHEVSHSRRVQWCKLNSLHSASAVQLWCSTNSSQRILIPAEFKCRFSGSLLMLLRSLNPSWVPSLLSTWGCFPQDQVDFQTLKTREVWDRKSQFFRTCFNKCTLVCQQTRNAKDAFRNIMLPCSAPTIQEKTEFFIFVHQNHPERLFKI